MAVIDISTIPTRDLAPGIHARVMHGQALSMMRVHIDAGSDLPEHSHPHEQATTVLSGHLRLFLADVPHELYAGMALFIPGGVPHHAHAILETDVIDVFTPTRDDLR